MQFYQGLYETFKAIACKRTKKDLENYDNYYYYYYSVQLTWPLRIEIISIACNTIRGIVHVH